MNQRDHNRAAWAVGGVLAATTAFGAWVWSQQPQTPTPVTVVAASPQSTSGQLLNYSAPSNYPDVSWLPYAINSVWNSPIGSSFKVDPNSSVYQAFYTSNFPSFQNTGFGLTNESQDYEHPIYFGRSGDPTYSVHCTASWASCDFGSRVWHIPSYALPAGGSDAHLAVIDETDNEELDCWSTKKLSGTGGTITAQSCGYGPITGPGLVFGQTAAGYALWAGIIRDQELAQGQINHALFLVMPCTSNATPVFPSNFRSTDTECAGNQGAPYGERFRLNMTDAQVAALPAPQWKKPIYYALERYGAYVGDTNANQAMGIQIESDEMYESAGYVNKSCPNNGAPCTPLTAFMHTLTPPDPGWNGNRYVISLSEVNWAKYGEWLEPPAH
jgi:hypothetical protein